MSVPQLTVQARLCERQLTRASAWILTPFPPASSVTTPLNKTSAFCAVVFLSDQSKIALGFLSNSPSSYSFGLLASSKSLTYNK